MADQYQQHKDTPAEENYNHTDEIPHELLTMHLKSHPEIWDSSHKNNHKTNLKKAVWNEIAQKCHPFSEKQLQKEYIRCRDLWRKRQKVESGGKRSRCTLDPKLWSFLDKIFQRKPTPFNSAATDTKGISTDEETQVNENLRKKYYYKRTPESENNTHSNDYYKTPVSKEMSNPETEVKLKRPATDSSNSKVFKRRKTGEEEVNVNKGSQFPRGNDITVVDLTDEDSIPKTEGNELGSYVKQETNKEDSTNIIKDLVQIQKKSISDDGQGNICPWEEEGNSWDNCNDSYDDDKLDNNDELITKDNSRNSINDSLGAVTNQKNLSSSEMNNSLQNQRTEEEEKSPRPVTQDMEETPFARVNNQTNWSRCSSNNCLENEGKEKPRLGAHHSADKRENIHIFTKDMADTPLSTVINQTRTSRSPSNNGLRNHSNQGPRFVAHHSTEEKNCPPRTSQDMANTSLAKDTNQTHLPHSQSNDHIQNQRTEKPRFGEDHSTEEKDCQPRTSQDIAETSLAKVTNQTHLPHSQLNDNFQNQCTEETRLGKDHSKEEKSCQPRTTQGVAETSLAEVTNQTHLPHSQPKEHLKIQDAEEPKCVEHHSAGEKNYPSRTTQNTADTSYAKVTNQTHLPHSQSEGHFQNKDTEDPRCVEHHCAGEKNYPSRTTQNTADTSYAKITNQTHLPHSQSEGHLQNKDTEDPRCVEQHSAGDKNYVGQTTQYTADTHLVTVTTQLQPSQPHMNEQRAKAEEAIRENVEHLRTSTPTLYSTDGETSRQLKNLIPLAQNTEIKHQHHPTDVPLEGDNIANFREFCKNSLDQHIKCFNDKDYAEFKRDVLSLVIGYLDTKASKK